MDIGVGLESKLYMIQESSKRVEVCIALQNVTSDCAIGFSFSVNLSTTDGSAGIYIILCTIINILIYTCNQVLE